MIGQGAKGVGERLGAPGLPGMRRSQLVWGGLAFVALTTGTFWWLFGRTPEGLAAPGLADLQWRYLPLLLLLLPVETVTSAARIWLICRLLHPGVSLWTSVRSELANVAISTLTPSQSGGGPGQIYVLSRAGGMSVGTGLTATLLSFMGTMAGLLLLGLYTLFSGGFAHGRLFLAPVCILTAIAGLLLLGATWPDAIRVPLGAFSRTVWRALRRPEALRDWWPPPASRVDAPADRMDSTTAWVADLLYTYREDVRRFLRHGKARVAAVCLLSVVFLLARALMPYLCARFLGVEQGTLRQILEGQVALIFLVFFAPTPGGAGVAEGASLWLMTDIVPPNVAPYYNLLWRTSTVYLAAIAGIVCLGTALARDAWRRGPGIAPPPDADTRSEPRSPRLATRRRPFERSRREACRSS